ncbi:hypothetical protein [Microlunatus speluncae]|uniref:hypothetical protein n=1 Tax=Microlunatus speluncae TaxID=2594267 RepID=UPI00126686B0|nr:hypothetical protein [Microlunatus speluncae]
MIAIESASPRHAHYLPNPREWRLQPTTRPIGPSRSLSLSNHDLGPSTGTVTCRSDGDVRVLADESDRPWTTLARGVLGLLTGWPVHDQIVDLAARTLRARAETETELSTAELMHPLVIQSIQHLGGLRRPAWIASEFSPPV